MKDDKEIITIAASRIMNPREWEANIDKEREKQDKFN